LSYSIKLPSLYYSFHYGFSSAILGPFKMADHNDTVVRDSRIIPSPTSNQKSTNEKICPVPSLDSNLANHDWVSLLLALFARFGSLTILYRWWVAGLVLHRYDLGWLIPFLLWLCLTIRLVTLHVSTTYITESISYIWIRTINKPVGMIPEKVRLPLWAAGTIAVIVVGTFCSPDSADNTRTNRAISLFGLLAFVGGFYATSRDRKNINWQTVIVGILAQFLLALFVLRTKAGVSSRKQHSDLTLIDNISTTFLTSLPT
jgi:hypothetical protein